MSSVVFYEGTAEFATLTNTFSVNGTPTDPTTVSLTVTDPAGNVTTYTYSPGTITRLSAGAYQQLVECNTTDGLWQYVWIGTGTASDVVMGTWRVFATVAGRWYTSLEEVKSRLGITDNQDDFEVELAVQAAARWVEGRCGRHFYQFTDTRTYVPESIWEAHIDDVVTVTTLQTDPNGDGTFPVTWTQGVNFELALGYAEYNVNATGEPRPYKAIYVIGGGNLFFPFVWPLYRADRIKVIGTFGWPAVPAAISQATLLLATDLFKMKDAPFGIAGSAELGMVKLGTGVTAQVQELVAPYIDARRKVGV